LREEKGRCAEERDGGLWAWSVGLGEIGRSGGSWRDRVAGRAGTGNEGMERTGERFGWYWKLLKFFSSCVLFAFLYKF
jgi:hypothetical protein